MLAHMSLASCYNNSYGVKQDFKKMFYHHQQASNSGNNNYYYYPYSVIVLLLGIVGAIYNIGTHYFAGKGVEHSFDKAIEYFQKASDLGFAPAQVTKYFHINNSLHHYY